MLFCFHLQCYSMQNHFHETVRIIINVPPHVCLPFLSPQTVFSSPTTRRPLSFLSPFPSTSSFSHLPLLDPSISSPLFFSPPFSIPISKATGGICSLFNKHQKSILEGRVVCSWFVHMPSSSLTLAPHTWLSHSY